MTVSQSIIRWLKQFKPEEYSGMKNINTDLQGADACTYVLYKEPIQNVKRYISGRSVHTDHYSIRARLSSQTNSDRIENGAWGELLTDWIEERNKNEDFPVVECPGDIDDVHQNRYFQRNLRISHRAKQRRTGIVQCKKGIGNR